MTNSKTNHSRLILTLVTLLVIVLVAFYYAPFVWLKLFSTPGKISSTYRGEFLIQADSSIVLNETLTEYQLESHANDKSVFLRGFRRIIPSSPAGQVVIQLNDLTLNNVRYNLSGTEQLEPEIVDFDSFIGFVMDEKHRPKDDKISNISLRYDIKGAIKSQENNSIFHFPLFSIPIMVIEDAQVAFVLPQYMQPDRVRIEWIKRVGETIATLPAVKKSDGDANKTTNKLAYYTKMNADGFGQIVFSGLNLNYGEELFLKVEMPT